MKWKEKLVALQASRGGKREGNMIITLFFFRVPFASIASVYALHVTCMCTMCVMLERILNLIFASISIWLNPSSIYVFLCAVSTTNKQREPEERIKCVNNWYAIWPVENEEPCKKS